jgi:hypothetical protein
LSPSRVPMMSPEKKGRRPSTSAALAPHAYWPTITPVFFKSNAILYFAEISIRKFLRAAQYVHPVSTTEPFLRDRPRQCPAKRAAGGSKCSGGSRTGCAED